tara:strand:+ start:367 stop:609 length:243 start_codon:yes stop_codon:yes gene_type:complete
MTNEEIYESIPYHTKNEVNFPEHYLALDIEQQNFIDAIVEECEQEVEHLFKKVEDLETYVDDLELEARELQDELEKRSEG